MKQRICALLVTGFFTLCVYEFSYSQDVSATSIRKIEMEIALVFEESIKAGEKLDVNAISEAINDLREAGFIDNGFYFRTFDELMVGFKEGIRGLEYQKMNIETKKITVLSEKNALLTAHGNYLAKVTDGRILNGKFAWTFVYSKVNGEWKVIHSHMSYARL